ncbi:MAG: hypothetical protein PSU93_09395 [Methylobacter sp.]|uniref:Uncharacterized protein n=1 Tax=Candidatus Methylobacter titanis TaxID=3053457 RepID=A0AA43Q496_9GAMM|nr:hypothetical protein [Candidatus Methylobacter titanis]
MRKFFINRLKEPSSWRGLILIATAFGMDLNPEQAYAIASFGIAMAGGVGVVTADKLRK